MPFKEHDYSIQLKVNSDALRQNIKQIKMQVKQLEYENKHSNSVKNLDNLFKRKEG